MKRSSPTSQAANCAIFIKLSLDPRRSFLGDRRHERPSRAARYRPGRRCRSFGQGVSPTFRRTLAPSRPVGIPARRGQFGPVGYLLSARAATRASRYPAAGEALGRAETRLLNDAAAIEGYPPPFLQRALADVQAARRSAGSRQQTSTLQTIDDALLALDIQGQSAVASPAAVPPPEPFLVAPASPPLSPPPTMLTPPPAVLYRLEPGHWQLQGARSVWVEAQSIPQPVSVEPLVPSRQVWNGDRWILVPEHFVNTEIPR